VAIGNRKERVLAIFIKAREEDRWVSNFELIPISNQYATITKVLRDELGCVFLKWNVDGNDSGEYRYKLIEMLPEPQVGESRSWHPGDPMPEYGPLRTIPQSDQEALKRSGEDPTAHYARQLIATRQKAPDAPPGPSSKPAPPLKDVCGRCDKPGILIDTPKGKRCGPCLALDQKGF
jgi:hypothetical protein